MRVEQIVELRNETQSLENSSINFYTDMLDKLSKKESIEVVFSGTLSNGKSTVVNAILGENLLQMGIGSTTAKITTISYGENSLYGIYKDDTKIKKELNNENFKFLNNDTNIDSVTIHKNNFKYQNIIFVDSPGINDVNQLREDISYTYVPLADIVVFVLDISKGLTADEKAFFDDKIIKSHKEKIFILLNGLDKVDGEDLTPILNAPLLAGYKLFPLSAKQYLSGIISNDGEKIEKSKFQPFLDEFNSYINSINTLAKNNS